MAITKIGRNAVESINSPAVHAVSSSNQSLSATTFTTVTLADEDLDTESDFSSNTFTPPEAGTYLILGSIGLECDNAGDLTMGYIRLTKTSSHTPLPGSTHGIASPHTDNATFTVLGLSTSWVGTLATSDIIRMQAYANWGDGSTNVQTTYSAMSVIKLAT
jgi:hypothetical protein